MTADARTITAGCRKGSRGRLYPCALSHRGCDNPGREGCAWASSESSSEAPTRRPLRSLTRKCTLRRQSEATRSSNSTSSGKPRTETRLRACSPGRGRGRRTRRRGDTPVRAGEHLRPERRAGRGDGSALRRTSLTGASRSTLSTHHGCVQGSDQSTRDDRRRVEKRHRARATTASGSGSRRAIQSGSVLSPPTSTDPYDRTWTYRRCRP